MVRWGECMAEVVFYARKPNREKLLSLGFEADGDGCVYRVGLAGGQLRLTVTVRADETVHTRVEDAADGGEYVLHLVRGAAGAFVGGVRAEYEDVLAGIAAKGFDPDVFKSEQAKAVIAYAREKHGDEPEYLWQKFPDNAVLRRQDNRKWYAALLTVSRRKLGFDADETVEILDLRMRPEDIPAAVDGGRYLPGYHMNKKHWITLCLDGSLPLEELCARLEESYALAKK